jgi:hypothetical protein
MSSVKEQRKVEPVPEDRVIVETSHVFSIQAVLAVNPDRPKWCYISATAFYCIDKPNQMFVHRYPEIANHDDRAQFNDGRGGTDHHGTLSFYSLAVAKQCLFLLRKNARYQRDGADKPELRIVEVRKTHSAKVIDETMPGSRQLLQMDVRLTKTQIECMRRKCEVMLDSPEPCAPGSMAEHYGFVPATLTTFCDKFDHIGKRQHMVITLDEREARAVVGELTNAADIAEDNSMDDGDEYSVAAARYIEGIARVRDAMMQAANQARRTS